jgi:sulfocyanin
MEIRWIGKKLEVNRMKQVRRGAFSPKGVFIVVSFLLFAAAFWVVGYFVLPNKITHRDLALNPPIESSAAANDTAGNGGGSAAAAPAAKAFYSLGTGKTLNLNLESGTNTANQGLNFNGYFNGQMVVTVPVGWKVSITYKNSDAMMPHSVGTTVWADRSAAGNFKPAFAGAIPSNFANGITKSNPATSFSFTADKAGQYALVCGIPGHATGGMWDELDVSASVKQPTIKTPSGTVTVH